MSPKRFIEISFAVAGRLLGKLRKNPGFAMPALLIPLFFFAAFAGGLSAVSKNPEFTYPNYTSFQFVFCLLQSAAFSGVFTGFSLADDFQTGFARRMMLGASYRMAIVVGYVITAFIQSVMISLILFGVGVAVGMEVSGSVPQVVLIFVLAWTLNVASTLFATGIALRLRSVVAAPLMLLPVFMVLFLAPVYVPREMLTGWLHTAANVNPLTPVLESGRGLLIGEPVSVALAFGCVAGMVVVLAVFAVFGMKSAERTV